MEAFDKYDWPGNVRELRNTIERIVILSDSDEIRVGDVPLPGLGEPAGTSADLLSGNATFQEFKDRAERDFLLKKLEENNWSVSQTARDLGMQRSNIYKKIEKYNLRRPSRSGDNRPAG
jgi:two-component system nitrogen regulation response regulator NtrX